MTKNTQTPKNKPWQKTLANIFASTITTLLRLLETILKSIFKTLQTLSKT